MTSTFESCILKVILIGMLLIGHVRGISVDCPNVIQFAFNLGIQSIQSVLWNSLQIYCCNSNGVTCTNQVVTKIAWDTMGLNGFINGSAIPSGVTDLELARNVLIGNIPS